MNRLIFVFFIVIALQSFGQDKSEIDSLIHIIHTTKKDSVKAHNFKEIGSIYFYEYAYKDAFVYYSKADSVCQQNEALKVSNLRASVYNYLGYAVRLTHSHEKAVEYYQKAIDMYKKTGNDFGMHEVNVAIAQAYFADKKYDEALPLLNKAITYHQNNNLIDKNSYSYAIICRGYLFILMQRLDEAEKDYLTYYNIAFSGNIEKFQLRALSYMGFFYKSKNDINKAYHYYNRCIEMAKEQENYELINRSYESIVDMYKTTKDTDSLVSNYQKYIDNRNIMDSINKNKEIYELEARYQSEKKEQEIALLTAEKQLAKKQKYLYFVVTGLLLMAVFFFFVRYRLKRTIAEQQKLLKIRENIARDLHDEIGSTLTGIKILSQVSDKTIKNDQAKVSEFLQQITEQSDKAQQGISDIVWSVNPKNDRMENMVARMHEYIGQTLESKNIAARIILDEKLLDENLQMNERRDFLMIFKEAINNISKYAEATQVTISIKKQDNKLQLKIADNGKGFDPAKVTSGNGLQYMHSRAEAIDATLSIRSEKGKGTDLSLWLKTT